MSKLRFKISLSLDGFVAGPNQSVDNPLGIGGMRLHEWALPLAVWRSVHGQQGGEVNESSRVVEESLTNIGATIMGRNMFGGHPGWDEKKPWNGWWGDNPPFHHPVFVLTRHARATLAHSTQNHVHIRHRRNYVGARARRVAGGKDVSLAGGRKPRSSILRQALWTKWN